MEALLPDRILDSLHNLYPEGIRKVREKQGDQMRPVGA
jgi:hypothetical protein